ncbi:MAG: endolytic transglycosylase MltG [Henriciella sp.]|nr:endolytic transglycosylase MltG [Henriciella sp.]
MQVLKALIAFVLVIGVLGAAALIGGWIWLQSEINKAGPAQSDTVFELASGEGLATAARRLEDAGLITDARLLRLDARLSGTEEQIKAGTYTIPAQASAHEILQQLIEGEVIQLKLTIPEGLTTGQILRRVRDSDVLTGEMPTEPIEEGVLLPDTYIFGTGTTRVQFIERMRAEQVKLLDELWPARADDIPIKTKGEAVILASIVEKETASADERDLVAGLFTRRLKTGMRLESDPTIIYGISQGEPLYNRNGERRTLYRSEIDRKTDWNTYQIDGLPKTPICNPGRDSIAAVLNPPDTNYVFFVADGKGGHLFAETYAEHQRNVAAYREYERQEIARERSN